MTNESGEAIEYGRSGFYIHGGGTGLNYPYDPNQLLKSTLGCIRTTNGSVNVLIRDARLAAEIGDPLDRLFVGSEDSLIELANQTDSGGNYIYPDLRLSLGATGVIQMTAEERDALEAADKRRRSAEIEARKRKEKEKGRGDEMKRNKLC
ncbi:MAG: hypothetical protein IPK58_21580 [Acidobacteria bacterium]|nr:hypothetical protein [Acidobacteriota bacterium]